MDEKTLTETLERMSRGEPAAMEALLPVVYAEMRMLAASYLRHERPGHTLQPTALAHEAWLRLAGQQHLRIEGRRHFLGIAARTMRAILVDHARRRRALKRGGGGAALTLDTTNLVAAAPAVAFDDLDRALLDLARKSERQARVVELRYFGGLSIEETADVLEVSTVTVKRDWALARAWLHRELADGEPPAP